MSSIVEEYKTKLSIYNIAKVCKDFKTKILKFTKNVDSQSTYFSKLNKFIKIKFGMKSYLISRSILILDPKIKLERTMRLNKVSIKKLKNRVNVDYDNYIDLMNLLKKSDKYYDIVALLIMSSGRRAIEIAKVGNFTISTNKTYPNQISMTGMAKKRPTSEISKVDFPLINLKQLEFLRLLKLIRKQKNFEKDTNEKVISIINSGLNTRFRTLGEECTTDVIRGIYADIIIKKYPNSKISNTVSKAHLLGHEDLTSVSMHYDRSVVINFHL
jgi:hypothetical protein